MFKSLIVRKFNIQTFKHPNIQTYPYNKKQLNLRMEKIKVLHITQAFGGVETYLRQVVQNIDKENAFSDADVRLLETLANSMSVALENESLAGGIKTQ